MSTRGYEVVGLEPFSLGTAPEGDRHLSLVRGSLEDVSHRLGQFDVITMWHVLEHLHTPVQTLTALGAHLASRGTLVVSVPNFESVQASLFRGGWFHLDPPRHVIQFEQRTLAECLQRAGLTVYAERPFLPEYGCSGWLQSTLNRVLPHKNYLYELVKDRGALRGMHPLSSAAHLCASALVAPLVLAASLLLEAVASKSNRGAALTVAARRSEES
jgi:hypothetical protein